MLTLKSVLPLNASIISVTKLTSQSGIDPYSLEAHNPSTGSVLKHSKIAGSNLSSVIVVTATPRPFDTNSTVRNDKSCIRTNVLKEANRPRLQWGVPRAWAREPYALSLAFILASQTNSSLPAKTSVTSGKNDDLNSVSTSLLTRVAEGNFR